MVKLEWSSDLTDAEPEIKFEIKPQKFRIINTRKDKQDILDYEKFIKENTKYVELFPLPVLPGKLNLIVAPSGNGKTTYLNNLAVSLASTGARVLYMTSEQEQKDIGIHLVKIEEHIMDETYPGIDIVYLDSMTEEKLSTTMKELKKLEYDYVCYDYIKFSTLITSKESYLAISIITDMFHRLMVVDSNKTVFFAAIQSNTEGQKRKDDDNLPQMWAAFVDGGGGAGRHAANVVWLQRDRNNNSDLTVCKNRDGNPELNGKKIHLNYDAATGRLKMANRQF